MIILFTSTVSHSMVNSALNEAKKYNIPVCRCRSSSAAALNALLTEEVSKRKACYV